MPFFNDAFPVGKGINFVVLHEFAHTINPVQQQTNTQLMNYMARTRDNARTHWGDTDSQGYFIHPEPREVERLANNAAVNMGNQRCGV